MVEGLVVFILIFLILFQAWQAEKRQKVFDEREKQLLDRIMSRSYETYVNGEIIKNQSNRPAAPVYEEEHGIPVI